MEEIKLNLTINEINLILESLGEQPFNKVFGLIGKIQEQASEQLQGTNASVVSNSPIGKTE